MLARVLKRISAETSTAPQCTVQNVTLSVVNHHAKPLPEDVGMSARAAAALSTRSWCPNEIVKSMWLPWRYHASSPFFYLLHDTLCGPHGSRVTMLQGHGQRKPDLRIAGG